MTSTTEGFWRQLEQRPGSPPVVKVGKVTLYELAPTLDWIRRNAVSA